MCDLISAVQWEDVGSRELGRSKGHSLSHELLKSSEDEHEVPSLSQQQWAESATVTTEGLYSVKHIKNSSFVSPLDPRGGYDDSVVFSGAAASLHVLIRRGVPFYTHEQDRPVHLTPSLLLELLVHAGSVLFLFSLLMLFFLPFRKDSSGHSGSASNQMRTPGCWPSGFRTVARGNVIGWEQNKLLGPLRPASVWLVGPIPRRCSSLATSVSKLTGWGWM